MVQAKPGDIEVQLFQNYGGEMHRKDVHIPSAQYGTSDLAREARYTQWCAV